MKRIPRKKIYVVAIAALLFFGTSLNKLVGQQLRQVQKNAYVTTLTTEVQQGRLIRSEGTERFTSLLVRYKGALGNAFVKSGDRSVVLMRDEHYDGEGEVSNLVIFDEPVSDFELYTGSLSGSIDVILIDAGELHSGAKDDRSGEHGESCEAPAQVDQSTWRAGLPEPQYNRSFTDTENIIVHHSATSNELTDYTNVVRNIYLYHTQVNGWSDIGYNYLIAPDGTIFKGRDPADGEQDFVLGAHFCGKNSTTMGVCLLGTYTNVAPSQAAVAALELLAAWKADKDGLDPLGVDPHPLDASLPVIAGHRDGCSTECPGQQTYNMLPQIRVETTGVIEACHEVEEVIFAVHPNPARYFFQISGQGGDVHEFALYDVKGRYKKIFPTGKIGDIFTFSALELASGMYIFQYRTENKLIRQRLVVMN